VHVYSTPSLTDGYLARGRLEAEGIPVFLKGEGEGPYRIGPMHLYVPEELEVQAVMLLDDVRSGTLEILDEDADGEGLDAEWRGVGSEPERSPE